MASKITRSTSNKLVGGVCAGAAKAFNTDPNTVRIIFAVATLVTGLWPMVILYGVAWAALPDDRTGRYGFDTLKEQYDEKLKPTVDEKVKPFYDANVKPTVDRVTQPSGEPGPAPQAPRSTSPLDIHPEDVASAEPTSVWEQPYESGSTRNPLDGSTDPQH